MSKTTLPSLPQDDHDPEGRAKALEKDRKAFRWDHDYLPPLAMLDEPGSELPSLKGAVLGLLTEKYLPHDAKPETHYVVERFFAQYRIGQNRRYIKEESARGAFSNVDECEELLVTLDRPLCVDSWRDDAFLAFQRVGGMNPMVLRRADGIPKKMALDDARVSALLPTGLSLADLGKTGRLYSCDYGILDGIKLGSYEDRRLFTAAPLALFWVDEGGALQPLAVQLGQDASADAVFTPADGGAWLVARTLLQIADMNHHEMATHLCRTHFVLEAFATVAERQLSHRHPVAVLLRPHLRIMLFNNFEGRELLIGPNGFASQIMAGGDAGSKQIVQRAYEGYEPRGVAPWSFDDWDLPAELAARGVDDAAALPDYPYRDDGLLVWEEVRSYVESYVRVYYESDAAVAGDPEIQAFRDELAAPDGAHVPNMPALRTRGDLVTILTRIVFTCGPQHAAINFSQWDFAGYPPNMAAAAYARPPEDLRTLPQKEVDALLLRILPPPAQAELQLRTIAQLCAYRFDRFGFYESGDFADPAAGRPIAELHEGLERCTLTIAQRNGQRRYPYPWMRPDRIPNSTSI